MRLVLCAYGILLYAALSLACCDLPKDKEKSCTDPKCLPNGSACEQNSRCGSTRCEDGICKARPPTTPKPDFRLMSPGGCDKPCAETRSPVCASNNKTYKNKCRFEVAKCRAERKGKKLEIERKGRCKNGCEKGLCRNVARSQVCGSDNKTYKNKCRFEVAKCRALKKGKALEIVSNGKCKKPEL